MSRPVCPSTQRLTAVPASPSAERAAAKPRPPAVLLSREAAAAALSVSPRLLDGLNLPCVRVGRRKLYRPESLRAWAKGQERGGDA